MIYKSTQESFNLTSTWTCLGRESNGVWRWFIAEGPYEARKDVEFRVSLPADAVIRRAWVSAEYGSPLSGAKYNRINGISVSPVGEVDLEGITAQTEVVSCTFAFMANGAIFENTDTHRAILSVGSPTLNIEYSSASQEAPLPDEDDPGNITRANDNGRYMPRLLDKDLKEVARIEPDRVSLELNLHPLSTAMMDIPPGQPLVKARDFVELFSPDGSVGIFRVSEVETVYKQGVSQRAYFEQAFTTLDDDLTVGVKTMSGTFKSVLSTLLEAQTTKHWVLGQVDIPDEYEVVYSYSYDTILHAVQAILDMVPEGYVPEFDTLHHPWRLHIRAFNDDDICECRMSRNLSSAAVTVETSSLCTRVYPFGTGEGTDRINLSTLTGALFMDADTIGTWGIVAKTFTNEEIFDSITLQEVAARYLERHKNPTVSVSLDAMSLYAATGEPLDRFRLGRLCRLPMNDYGVIMNERVVSISYPDVYGTPEKATVTLANKIRNLTDEIADLMRETSSTKLIGGTVETTEFKNSAGEITSSDPMVSTFQITSYGNLLAAKVRYTATDIDGNNAKCRVRVDGNTIEGAQDMAQPIDIMRYIKTDESGVPVVGDHYVELSPVASYSYIEHWVHSTVILKTIEKN